MEMIGRAILVAPGVGKGGEIEMDAPQIVSRLHRGKGMQGPVEVGPGGREVPLCVGDTAQGSISQAYAID